MRLGLQLKTILMEKIRLIKPISLIRKIILLNVVIAFFYSCKNNEFDSTAFAKEYCDCMTQKLGSHDFLDARTICDAELIRQNKFFRISYIERNNGRYMMFLKKETRDSVAEFHLKFGNFLEKNCCKVAVVGCDTTDKLQMRRFSIDTIKL
jgi:hypothetical protein